MVECKGLILNFYKPIAGVQIVKQSGNIAVGWKVEEAWVEVDPNPSLLLLGSILLTGGPGAGLKSTYTYIHVLLITANTQFIDRLI